ncbi:DUF7286 family protein [Halorarum halobium]|uniref:DUF7286 family protein n=1 Tax=Halorarum halobium TaxID=3075121 RepID=UPI0028ACE1BB|nr:hypothetical protein [Halobaculum sp. XH14]
MTAGSSDRARVPFALVGVVLLLGSVAYANTLALSGPVGGTAAASETLERAESSARPAVRAAATAAAREAAMNPVIEPADTPVGRSLNRTDPFRDALKLRIHGSVARALSTTRVDDGRTVATASLPAVDSTADLHEAKRRIRVRSVDDGTAMTVTVRNVTLTARNDGGVVATERTSYVVTVAVPVLAMHERTRRYERRLNASPLEGPGLGRQLTWRLTAVAQARGLAQYGGAPVQNVLANRHVELSTNAAALREQRAAFGRADPEGRAGVLGATARVGMTDLVGPATRQGPVWTETVLSAASAGGSGSDDGIPHPANSSTDAQIAVGVNHTADVAFAGFIDSKMGRQIDRAYRAEVTRTARVTSSDRGRRPPPSPPGPNVTLLDERRDSMTTVLGRTGAATKAPREYLDTTVAVQVTHTAVRTWRTPAGIETTRVHWRDDHEVRIRIEAAHLPPAAAPDRNVSPAFVRGGALDGPNLADVRGEALGRLAGSNTIEQLARSAVHGRDDTTTVTLSGDRPAELDEWVYADVAFLREEIRNVTVTVDREAVAAGDANAPAALVAEIRERRSSLVSPPSSYDGVADNARVAARAAYVDRVLARLDQRAGGVSDRNDEFRQVLDGSGVPLAGNLDDVASVTADRLTPEPRPVGGRLAGPVVLTPDTEPSYLTVTAVEGSRLDGVEDGSRVYPLAARNTNVFTVPSGDAADAVTETVFSEGETASLRTGGLALIRANRTLDARQNRTLRRQRDELATAVAGSMSRVRARANQVLEAEGGGRLSASDRGMVLREADAEFAGTGARAVAATNGTYADAVARAAGRRSRMTPNERDRLALRLRIATTNVAKSSNVAVDRSLTNETVGTERRVARELVREAVAAGTDRAARRIRDRYANETVGPVVAGLPVAPVPGYWYATVNVWGVEVRGYYPRFTVEARTGPPDGTGSVLRYVRDGDAVRFDADGDGEPELVGRNERVSFRTETVVLVAVPTGAGGVGDVDGNADERSAGWPCPDDGVSGCDVAT